MSNNLHLKITENICRTSKTQRPPWPVHLQGFCLCFSVLKDMKVPDILVFRGRSRLTSQRKPFWMWTKQDFYTLCGQHFGLPHPGQEEPVPSKFHSEKTTVQRVSEEGGNTQESDNVNSRCVLFFFCLVLFNELINVLGLNYCRNQRFDAAWLKVLPARRWFVVQWHSVDQWTRDWNLHSVLHSLTMENTDLLRKGKSK